MNALNKNSKEMAKRVSQEVCTQGLIHTFEGLFDKSYAKLFKQTISIEFLNLGSTAANSCMKVLTYL